MTLRAILPIPATRTSSPSDGICAGERVRAWTYRLEHSGPGGLQSLQMDRPARFPSYPMSHGESLRPTAHCHPLPRAGGRRPYGAPRCGSGALPARYASRQAISTSFSDAIAGSMALLPGGLDALMLLVAAVAAYLLVIDRVPRRIEIRIRTSKPSPAREDALGGSMYGGRSESTVDGRRLLRPPMTLGRGKPGDGGAGERVGIWERPASGTGGGALLFEPIRASAATPSEPPCAGPSLVQRVHKHGLDILGDRAGTA